MSLSVAQMKKHPWYLIREIEEDKKADKQKREKAISAITNALNWKLFPEDDLVVTDTYDAEFLLDKAVLKLRCRDGETLGLPYEPLLEWLLEWNGQDVSKETRERISPSVSAYRAAVMKTLTQK